jgi:V-type H+-transporting ATPase subunit C
MHFWLVSAPAETSKDAVFSKLQGTLGDLSTNYKLKIPDLKVGTLDSLMSLAEDLERIDRNVESVVHRIEKELREFSDGTAPTIEGGPVERCLTSFDWDAAQFPTKYALSDLVAMFQDIVARADEELKSKLLDYNQLKSALAQAERKTQGGLNTRSIVDYVKKHHVVTSEKFTTVFLAVPKFAVTEFLNQYEAWSEFSTEKVKLNGVVPRSAMKVEEDQDFELYRVVVFRNSEEEFKTKARENRLTVRDFSFAEGQAAADGAERQKLKTDTEKSGQQLQRWAKTAYTETFRAWMHLKAVRVFVESVLRYGLPANFQAMLIKPVRSGNEGRLRQLLKQLYGHLASSDASEDKGGDEGSQKWYPYVSIDVKVFSVSND